MPARPRLAPVCLRSIDDEVREYPVSANDPLVPRITERRRELEAKLQGALPASSQSARAVIPAAQQRVSPCDTSAAYHVLDFWLGEWDVTVGSQRVGTNRIEKVVHGCGLLEHWTDATGREGKSLFYYDRARREWKQVWVDATTTKEKRLVARLSDGGVLFQGELPRPDGTFMLDRTTVTPLAEGRVRQLIERSADGGRTWSTSFDAMYIRTSARK